MARSPLSPNLAHPEHVFEFYDEPVLFTCRNSMGMRWLVVLTDAEARRRSWLAVPLTDDRFSALTSGHIELRTVFAEVEGGQALVVLEDGDSYTETSVRASLLTEGQLPAAGERLEIEAPVRPEFPIVQRARSYRNDAVALRLKLGPTGFGGEANVVPAGVLGATLSDLQRTLSAIGQATHSAPASRGRISGRVAKYSELQVASTFAGSFGVELRPTEVADMFFESPIVPVLDTFVRLLEATQNKDKNVLLELASKLKRRPIRRFLDLLHGLQSGVEGLEIRWARPDSDEERRAVVSPDGIDFGVDFLSNVGELEQEEFQARVQLIGANVRTGTFEVLDVLDRTKYSGRVADEARAAVSGARLKSIYDAVIEESYVETPAGEDKPRFRLLELTALSAEQD